MGRWHLPPNMHGWPLDVYKIKKKIVWKNLPMISKSYELSLKKF